MRSKPMVSILEQAQERELDRWERLREIFEKLRLVVDMPAFGLCGADDLLEQLDLRLSEAGQFFPEPDWLETDTTSVAGVEQYCANHVGAVLEILQSALGLLSEKRAEELALGGPDSKD